MQPIYNEGNVWLYHSDNVEFMRSVPEGVVDLTVTSPPYDNLRTYTEESVWTFDKFKLVANELYRITSEGGVVVWNVNDATIKGSETCTSFKQVLYFIEIGFSLHDTMLWIKDGGGAVGSNRTYTQNFEYMFVLSKGRCRTVNLICDVENGSFHKIKTARTATGRRKADGTLKIETRPPPKEFKRRNNWWYIPPQASYNHPAPFPLALASDHIITWSNEGDLVFDPFMGSGTTGVAAKRLNRRVMGCEIAKEYVDIQIARLEKESAQ